jgi:hypothetical protein
MTERDEPSVSEPPNALLSEPRPTSARDTRFDDREALELHQFQTREDDDQDYSDHSGSSGDEDRVTTQRATSRVDSQRELPTRKGVWGQICRFWVRHVILTVSQKSNRDHFGTYGLISAGRI